MSVFSHWLELRGALLVRAHPSPGLREAVALPSGKIKPGLVNCDDMSEMTYQKSPNTPDTFCYTRLYAVVWFYGLPQASALPCFSVADRQTPSILPVAAFLSCCGRILQKSYQQCVAMPAASATNAFFSPT
ncbi:hypothetical protein STEG23_015301 [Scotinomys teguina]